tara:strand:- start:6175 stop:6819 length:645 start_codon:yes stop_codon:yes gene_type:complete
MSYSIIIGIDPGISGAVAIFEGITSPKVLLFDTPTWTESKVKKKKKSYIKHYDKAAMADLLRPYAGKDVVVCMEKVGAMTGQGVTSMFSFGRGVGLWEGVIAGLGFDYEEVSPSVWKKEYGDRLIQKRIPKPDEAKLTRAELAKMDEKKREAAKDIKREYEAEKRRGKQSAKDTARELAMELYPEVKDDLSKKRDSDRAEALLIAERKRRELDA